MVFRPHRYRRIALLHLALTVVLFATVPGIDGAGALSGTWTKQPPVATAQSADELERQFVIELNEVRAASGLPPLVPDPELGSVADDYAEVILARQELVHASDLSAGVQAPWNKLGENLGVGPQDSLGEIMDAFVASPTHLANIVDPDFRYVGVGVIVRDGRMWTVHRFRSEPDRSATERAGSEPVSVVAFDQAWNYLVPA